jgi:type IV pilus assembly protein PilB
MNATAVADERSLLIELLLQRGAVTPEGLRELRSRGQELNERNLILGGLVGDSEIARTYAEYLAVPLYDPGSEVPTPEPELARLLTEKLCRDQTIAPVAIRGDQLDLAFVTPREMLVIDEVQLLTGLRVRPMIAPIGVVEQLIEDLYRSSRSPTVFTPDAESFEHADLDDEVTEEEDRAGTLMRPRLRGATAGSSAWSTRSSNTPSAPGRATSTSNRSKMPARFACGSTGTCRSIRS